jgi:hypothetical protein
VSHHESSRAAFIKVDDAAYEGDEDGNRRLEEFVTRPGLEHGQYSLAVVALRIEPKSLDDLRHLVANHRDFRRRRKVSGGGPKADESMLAAYLTTGVEIFDSDVIEVAGAMYR